MRERRDPGKYSIKVDDLLLSMLKSYHDLDASEVISFFGERANEMFESEPNVTNKSRKPRTYFVDGNTKKTVTFGHKYNKSQTGFNTRLQEMDVGKNKVYVLRGYYPETHIPFKMTLVKFDGYALAHGKVKIGLKEHHTKFDETEISEYNENVSEAILLEKEVEQDKKLQYEYRKFKCMRPKGMKLYHEKK